MSVSIVDFGGDPTGVVASDAAFVAAVAAVTVGATGAYIGGPRIYFPPGTYRFDSSIQLKKTIIMEGDSVGQEGGQTATLKFPANTHGIIVHRYNTIGETVESSTTTAGDASIIRNLRIVGTKTGVIGHGIWLRARATIEQVYVKEFSGNGINIVASSGGGVDREGNANNFHIARCRINACNGHGLFIDGADVNAGVVLHLDCAGNGGWGVFDSSFLGNVYVGCHVTNNATKARVYHNGAYWICGFSHAGVEPGTNAARWYRYADGAGPVSGYPQWDAVTVYPEGGAYKSDNINQQTVFLGCYAEGGNPSYFARRTMFLGGTVTIGEVMSDSAGTMLYGRNQAATFNKLAILAPLRDAVSGAPLGNIEFEMLNQPDQGVVWSLRHPSYGNGFYYLRLDPNHGGLLSLRTTSSSQAAWNWTLATTTQKFGRVNPVPYATYVQRLFIGSTMDGARQITMHSGPPTGEAGVGDVVFNQNPVPGGYVGWVYTAASGWKRFGLIAP